MTVRSISELLFLRVSVANLHSAAFRHPPLPHALNRGAGRYMMLATLRRAGWPSQN